MGNANCNDIFMFIIWNNAYPHKDRILEDISQSFEILKTVEITWSKEKFNENINRFYGVKLPANSFKEKACGLGPFTFVLIKDPNPKYENRKTTRGVDEYVNINTFDKKMLYRKWTKLPSGNNCLHGTNSPEETEHDVTLLFGMTPEELLNKINDIPDTMAKDLVGSNGWDSLKQMFYILNHTCRYVFLRNFEGMPDSFHIEGHDDIDLLADNLLDIKLLTNSREVFKYKYRVQCLSKVAGKDVQFDFRYLGDGYYDTAWENTILEHRIYNNGIYIPSSDDYKYMLLYHALVHKREIAPNYIENLNAMFGENNWGIDCLNSFMNEKGYKYTEPYDISVYYNESVIGKKMSLKRNIRIFFRKIRWKVFNDRG